MGFAAYLLDIEGTTTPIDFVTRTLFPFARERLSEFVSSANADDETELLLREFNQDVGAGLSPPKPFEIVSYLNWLMDQDRKSTALKSIQGRIWEQGYADGSLQGELYPDVEPTMRRWIQQGSSIHIFSSGSILAQQLIFRHSNFGDLTRLISGYYDTTTGPKRESRSYELIAEKIGIAPSTGLFLSDIGEEVNAAREADWNATLVIRGSNQSDFPDVIQSFDVVP